MKTALRKILIAAAVLTVMLLCSACGLDGVELPPLPEELRIIDLPPFPTFQPAGDAADFATPPPSSEPTPEPTPIPVQPSPEPTPEPVPESAEEPALPEQPLAPPETTQTAAEPVPGTPVITLKSSNLPTDMTYRSVQNLVGYIEVDTGSITLVSATITDAQGNLVQEYNTFPMNTTVSIAGTVNANLHFANLEPGAYIYSLVVRAMDQVEVTEVLVDSPFTVYPQGTVITTNEKNYVARLSEEEGDEAAIWNFFINEFQSPYAAAAIMANMYAESGCVPQRVEGDITGYDVQYSINYTELVDNGTLTRDQFLYWKPDENHGNGYGLCQWGFDRKGILYDMAKARGTSVGDAETQCYVVMYELIYYYADLNEAMRTSNDVSYLTMEFCNKYEQPTYRAGRTAKALEYLEYYALEPAETAQSEG